EMLELTKDDPLCSIMLNPHSVYTTNREILNSIGELARTKNLALHMHLSESKSETAQSLELHNLRPVDYLKDLGFLDLPCSLAHVVDVDSHDLDLLAANPQTVIIHNPSSNLKLASGFAPIPNMLKRNLKVSLGTDSCASNNQLNMFLEMRQAALMHKGLNLDPTLLPAQKVLDFATLGGAQAFHQSSFGSLEVGKSADLIALDLRKPNLQPLYAPASQVVYAATGHEVILTMVAGKVLYDEGHFTTLDYPLLCEEMAKIRAYFMKIS
ncbi:MAG: amidohydrolase family protein, partial [Desulfovibrionaceae bacterium]|nr:amidohydrolase family protein [Desulfovibrionaceae bacterium]